MTVERHTCKEADELGSVIYQLLMEGEEEGWVSGLPPDASQRLSAALEAYCVDPGLMRIEKVV